MLGGDVVDQLLDEHRLAHAGAAEQADLSAFGVGANRSMTLMPVSKMSTTGRWFSNAGAGGESTTSRWSAPGPSVDGVAQNVEHAAQHALAHGDGDGRAGGGDGHAAAQALTGESMMQRTVSPPTCWATSMTSRRPSSSTSRASFSSGRRRRQRPRPPRGP